MALLGQLQEAAPRSVGQSSLDLYPACERSLLIGIELS